MGGMQCFGPVLPEVNEPLFHAPWEARVMAMTVLMGATGMWNIDTSRAACEAVLPGIDMNAGDYEIWLHGLIALLKANALISDDELRSGNPGPDQNERATLVRARKLNPAGARQMLARGAPTLRKIDGEPRFAPGDRVKTLNIHPPTHTRLPRYCRGRVGTIERLLGAHVFADSHALRRGEAPQWLYTVCFDASELWGPDTTASSICVDCWQSYLEPA